MPFAIHDGTVSLSGGCGIEEAEALHAALCGIDQPVFQMAAGATLHTAIVQLLLAAGGPIRPAPADPLFVACLRAFIDAKDAVT